MSKLWLFISAVLEHWTVLVTGGIVTAALAVLQAWLQKSISWRVYRWVLVAFIAAACFLAWRDEYDRAQHLSNANATKDGQLQERERRIDELRSRGGSEEDRNAIERLQAAKTQLEADLHVNQDTLVALQNSLTPRHLSPEERRQLTEALARHDGHQFDVISVVAGPSCQECMLYRDEIVKTIMSVPGWSASGDIEMNIRPDLTGIVIGVKDPKTPPPKAGIIAGALNAAKLPFIIGTTPYLSPDKLILIIGNKP